MQRHFRRTVCLMASALIVMSLTIGVILAHEGRPAGDYRLIVGWMEEPAYEGSQNAVSIRVNKIVEGEAAGSGDNSHGPPGHHDADPKATPSVPESSQESSETDQHHGTEDSDTGSSASQRGEEKQDGMASMTHGEGGHHDGVIEASSHMSVSVEATVDSVSGVNVHIQTQGFAFAPDNVNGDNVDGEGHAHVYVDGVKITRVYDPWVYLGEVEPGEHEIKVSLNVNSHGEYTYNGAKVEATTHIAVPEPSEHSHALETVEAENHMSVSLRVEQDAIEGGNLYVETDGFTFAPQDAGGSHVAGQGHAHVYVNGVKVGRIYGRALQLGNLAAGENEVRVTLNANDHSIYTIDGEAVEDTAVISIAEGMGGTGYGAASMSHEMSNGDAKMGEGDHHGGSDSDGQGGMEEEEDHSNGDSEQSGGHSSSVQTPEAGAKPLASVAGQDEGVAVPVEGLEGSLQVEVTHVSRNVSRTFNLKAVWGDPGHYVAGLIPTASGIYEFRFFGTIEGTTIDETFVSQGGGGDFNDIQSSGEIQFPVQLPEIREIESGARGALSAAQEAQDIALAAQNAATSADGDGGNALTIVALIIGIVGSVLGAGGVFLGLRGRQ